jgi:hypothetical protein
MALMYATEKFKCCFDIIYSLELSYFNNVPDLMNIHSAIEELSVTHVQVQTYLGRLRNKENGQSRKKHKYTFGMGLNCAF